MRILNLISFVIILMFSLFARNAKSQIVGSDIFLKGHYVEIGIGKLGYYGSDSLPPAGYHPHTYASTANNLGFVADPEMTGWSTTTTGPHYWGDYFYPGSPFEGWELQVDSQRVQAFDPGPFAYGGIMPPCTGSNTAYTVSGSKVIGTWQGTVDSIALTQITTLDTNNLYFTVQIILTNTATTPRNNIFYARMLDPDNDVSWPGGNFTTNNKIVHQSVGNHVVSATGLSSAMSYMALGTSDSAANAYIYNTIPLSPDFPLGVIYNCIGGYGAMCTAGDSIVNDVSIGLVFYISHLASVDSASDSTHRTTSSGWRHPLNSASFNYFFSFSADATDSALAYTHWVDTGGVVASTLETKITANTSDIKVYPNPSRSYINVTNLNTNDKIMLYDMMGREQNQNWLVTSPGTNMFKYNDIPSGGYILAISDANGNVKIKIPLKKQ